MNNLLTSSIIAMLCLPAASHAQQINDSEKTAVEQVLNKCAVGGAACAAAIGKVMGVKERYSELRRVIVECLMVNPYIKSIDSVTFAQDGPTVTCNITLTSIYGEVSLDV